MSQRLRKRKPEDDELQLELLLPADMNQVRSEAHVRVANACLSVAMWNDSCHSKLKAADRQEHASRAIRLDAVCQPRKPREVLVYAKGSARAE